MDDKAIVLFITMFASFLTWKFVKDFYISKFHMLFAHIIAIMTATFMFLSTILLFAVKDFKRGEEEIVFSLSSFVIVIFMVGTIYVLFKYLPSRKKR